MVKGKGVSETEYGDLVYFLHTLQLMIHDFILNQRTLKEIFNKCKETVGRFTFSIKACQIIEELQKTNDLPHQKFLQDVFTY